MAKKQFKSESKRLLDLMINSIYTHKEIFIRELISNASDAIDKMYYKALTTDKLKFDKDNYKIKIVSNKEERTLKIIDTGIGMSKEDMKLLLETHQEKNDGFNKLGIYNVNKKIQLNFGLEYGITFSDNLPFGGVKTVIKLPIIKSCNNNQNFINGGI